MERREDGPLLAHWSKCLVQPFEWRTCLWWERRFLVGLILAEYDKGSGVEIDIAPTKSTAALIIQETTRSHTIAWISRTLRQIISVL